MIKLPIASASLTGTAFPIQRPICTCFGVCWMMDISHQHWFNNIVNTTMYSTYKSTLELEIYLSEVVWRRHRVALARLCTGSNQLAVNKLRGQLPRHEWLCKYCIQNNRHKIEDEYHLVIECPLYRDLSAYCNNCKYSYIFTNHVVHKI